MPAHNGLNTLTSEKAGGDAKPATGTDTAANKALTGTVSITAGERVVTGVSTLFTTELVKGDVISIESESLKVEIIVSDTVLITTELHVAGASAKAATKVSVKRALDVVLYDAAGKLIGPESIVAGLQMADGDEISITLGNITYTAKDQIEDDSTEIPNFSSQDGGIAVLDFVKIQNSIGGATGKLDLDILISESVLVTSSSDGTAIGMTAANMDKIQHVVEVREHHWNTDLGTLDNSAYIPINDLLQKIKTVGAASAYFTLVWRGIDLAVGSSETLKLWFGTTYLDAA